MFAVVKYARYEGMLLSIDFFTDEEGPAASSRLSDLEEVNSDENIEIVLFCANSEKDIRANHGKYFSERAMRNIRAEQTPVV